MPRSLFKGAINFETDERLRRFINREGRELCRRASDERSHPDGTQFWPGQMPQQSL